MPEPELTQKQLETRSECLEIVSTLSHGLQNGSLTNNGAQLLLTVLTIHLVEGLKFKRIEPPTT